MADDRLPRSAGTVTPVFRWTSTLRPYRAELACLGVCLLVQTAFYSGLPMSFQVVMDRAVLKHDRGALVTVLSLLVVAVVAAALTGLWQDRLGARVVAGLLRDLRARMFEQLQRLSLRFYARTSEGDIVTRFPVI